MSHPIDDLHDDMILIGNKPGTNQVPMHKIPRAIHWMDTKYGKQITPWEVTVKFENTQGNNFGQWNNGEHNKLLYSFCKKNDLQGQLQWEREPKRFLDIQDPSKYRGQLGGQGSSIWHNTDRVFIVNGNCTKADGNFIGDFFYRKIGETGITLGSYPATDMDVQTMYEMGVTAVLDI